MSIRSSSARLRARPCRRVIDTWPVARARAPSGQVEGVVVSVEQQWSSPRGASGGDRDRLTIASILTVVAPTVIAAIAGFAIGRTTAPSTKPPRPSIGAVATSATTVAKSPTAATTTTDALLQSALALHAAGKLDQASAAYNEVLAKDPKNKYAFYNLGQIAQSSGKLDEAITQYKQSLAQDPNYFPALYNVGLAYAAKGDHPTAIDSLRKALVIQPTSAGAMFNLGTLLSADGKGDEGTKLIADAIAIDPSLAPKS